MATVEGARCLGRDDIGSLQPGKRADVAMFDLRGVGYSGAGDAVSALLLCAPAQVDTLVVEGRVVVEGGALQTISLESILRRHRKLAAKLVGGAGASVCQPRVGGSVGTRKRLPHLVPAAFGYNAEIGVKGNYDADQCDSGCGVFLRSPGLGAKHA